MPDRSGAPPRAWQRMLSGRRLDILDPSPLDVEIEDIAHGLARVARWNGQTSGDHAYSVAQHSLLVEHVLRLQEAECVARDRLATLLHDAPEYVIGDLISPFKAVIAASYHEVESRLHTAIRLRFGLPAALPPALRSKLKKADQTAAYFEAVTLAGFGDVEAARFFGRPGRIGARDVAAMLEPWPARKAEAAFLRSFRAMARLVAEPA